MSEGIHFVEMNEETFLQEAVAVIDKAQARGVPLRILGAMAIYAHSPDRVEFMKLSKSLPRFGEGKPTFTDLDVVGYKKQQKEISKTFEELGYKPDYRLNAILGYSTGGRRLYYNHPQDKYHVDIFLDRLSFSHIVNFGDKPGSGRLELDNPTITLADIVLEKTQIHFIDRKDIIDLILLFATHDVEPEQSKDTIDGKYIATVLSDDWGFWYDSTTNLDKAMKAMETFRQSGNIPEAHAKTVTDQINKLRKIIDETPKTKNWEKRAKTGTNKPWYSDTEEVQR
ncbi:MAG TPA: hypothetical protein VEG61_07170 [Candidatus Dormibacteraeota bacterium]|nr:hypothetical protein [Candidatus Dormibacteraeota bacterium]